MAIVQSRFNEIITDRLLAGARNFLREQGIPDSDVDVFSVPGAWELPVATRYAIASGHYAAVIALGCVIRGETPHFDFIAGAATEGLARLALEEGCPITFGVLTTDTQDQALARAGGDAGNKGREAAAAALEMIELRARLAPDARA